MIDHPPAIIQVRPALDLRLHVNGERSESPLPRDFLSMPRVLRSTVAISELRSYLPAEYRLVPDDLLAGLLYANLPGFPGALMAGTIKKVWLYTASGQFQVPGDWNKRDCIIHALGGGGNGMDGFWDELPNGDILGAYGGGGGGGGAWAALINRALQFHALLDLVIAPGGTSSTSTWFSATDVLLAASGSASTGVNGGASGKAASSVGDQANDGGNGDGTGSGSAGGRGGGAGGPHGAGTYDGDAGYGGASGSTVLGEDRTGGDGVNGPAGGFNPGGKLNAGPGGGGYLGFSDQASGGNGGLYGGAGGGGGATFDVTRPGGLGRQGCLLLINNTRA